MHIYAYNNPYNNMGQILTTMIPFGIFAGKTFDAIFEAPEVTRKSGGGITVSQPDGEKQLMEITEANDVIITSTLTNFSIDFIAALQTVADFDNRNVRVIAYQEDFDSSRLRERVLLASLPMMHKFRRNAFKAKRKNRIAGIEKAAAEGKYKGRKSLSPADFPEFGNLFNSYMMREIGKGEFAEKLGVSRPTLDKLLDDFTKKKGE